MFINIFRDIIKFLPIEFLTNDLFNSVIERLINELPQNINNKISRISLNEELYVKLTQLYPNTDYFNTNEQDENLLNITIHNSNELLIIKIKKENDVYTLKILTIDEFCIEKHINITIYDELTKMESLIKKENKGFITRYEYDIKAFDSKFKLLPLDYESLKDLDFSEEFKIPLKSARQYRLNFESNIEYLNTHKIKEINRLIDNSISDSLFRGPFKINDLELFIKKEMINDIKDFVSDMDMSFSLTDIFKEIIANLKTVIGSSNNILISENMYKFLQDYLLGLYNHIIYNKGILIKELNGIYTLYYIHFENNQIIAVPKELTTDDIDLIIINNNQSSNLNNLKDFFGISNSLK